LTKIYVDGDACSVKDEIYKVAKRYELEVIVVANAVLRVPQTKLVTLVLVEGGLDIADDWIAENATSEDIVITADIPLAGRCLENEATVLDMRGGAFTEDRIGEALASRELHSVLRDMGLSNSGPAPFTDKDRSQFLQKLDQAINAHNRRKKT
jgi:uncharacterized protein YaiI (UPF0178 family)